MGTLLVPSQLAYCRCRAEYHAVGEDLQRAYKAANDALVEDSPVGDDQEQDLNINVHPAEGSDDEAQPSTSHGSNGSNSSNGAGSKSSTTTNSTGTPALVLQEVCWYRSHASPLCMSTCACLAFHT